MPLTQSKSSRSAVGALWLGLALTGQVAAEPVSVSLAGSFQSELGCAADFDLNCAATTLVYDSTDRVWQRLVPALVAGEYSYIGALNGTFDVRYGLHAQQNGPNIPLTIASTRPVKFYYDDASHWLTDNVSSTIAVLAGSFQSELGCASDFDPSCLRSWLQDIDGDGIYTLTTSELPQGDYSTVVAIDESFDEVYGAGGVARGSNVAFSVGQFGDRVDFSYDSRTHVLTIQSGVVAAVPEPSTWAMVALGLAAMALRRTASRRSHRRPLTAAY